MAILKELLLLWRDKFTGWWLLDVCDMPKTALCFCQELGEQIHSKQNEAGEQ